MTAEITDKKETAAMKKEQDPIVIARKKRKRKQWVKALTNPHLLISVAIAWFITNGWSYCALGLGWLFEIGWLRNIGAVYLAILWAPGTPEKLITFGVAMVVLRVLFPQDTRTLAMLRRKRRLVMIITKMQFKAFKEKLFGKKKQEPEAEQPEESGSDETGQDHQNEQNIPQ